MSISDFLARAAGVLAVATTLLLSTSAYSQRHDCSFGSGCKEVGSDVGASSPPARQESSSIILKCTLVSYSGKSPHLEMFREIRKKNPGKRERDLLVEIYVDAITNDFEPLIAPPGYDNMKAIHYIIDPEKKVMKYVEGNSEYFIDSKISGIEESPLLRGGSKIRSRNIFSFNRISGEMNFEEPVSQAAVKFIKSKYGVNSPHYAMASYTCERVRNVAF